MKDIDITVLSELVDKQDEYSEERLREIALSYSPDSWVDNAWDWANDDDNGFPFARLIIRMIRSLRGDEPLYLVACLASNLQMVVQWVDEDMVDIALILEEEFYNKKLQTLKEYRQGLAASYGTHPDTDYSRGSACDQVCNVERDEEALQFDLAKPLQKVERFLAK